MATETFIKSVVWRLKAIRRLDEATTWCYWQFGERVALKFYKEAQRQVTLLELFPRMAPVEELLKHRPLLYRSLSVRPHFKLIYYVDESQSELHIVDFWDVRRDPKQLTNYINMQVK